MAAINSYTLFCTLHNEKSWPVSMTMLEEWAATRIYEITLSKQGQIKPDIVMSYLSAFKSYHINQHLSFEGIDNLRIAVIIKRRRRLIPSTKLNCLPITKNIFQNIMKDEPFLITDLNIDTTFKVA